MEHSIRRIGVIGLGRMGRRIAARLLDAKYELNVYDLDASKVQALHGPNVRAATTPSEVAQDAQVVLTMVTDGKALLAVLDGPNGLLAGARPGLLLLDMSTIGLEHSRQVAQACQTAQVDYVRSPVLGTLPSAESGQLTALVSGPEQAVKTATTVLSHLCARQHYLGPAEQGRAAKLIVNGLLAGALAAFAEGMVLGEKAGLDWNQLLDVVGESSMASPAIKGTTQSLRARDFDPRLTIALLVKDLRLIGDAAAEVGATLSLLGTALPMYQAAANMGWAERDTSAILLLVEALSGVAHPAPPRQIGKTNQEVT